MRKVLLTGATGFIGRHVLQLLRECGGYEIHAVTSRALPSDVHGVEWHRTDLLDAGQVALLMRTVRPGFLMHFAWYTEHGKYWTSEKNLMWEQATIGLIKRFYENGGQRMVGAGTCAEYAWGADCLSEERTPLIPDTLYGQSKLHVWDFLRTYSQEYGKSSVWGRIFFLYGPYEDKRRLVPSVICALLQNKLAQCTHGNQVRDFLYVQDVASAFLALLESDAVGAVNIASGRYVCIKDIVNIIGDKLRKKDFIRLGAVPASVNDPNMLVAKTERLNGEVGWSPQYSLDIGLDLSLTWWKDHLLEGKEE